ncbi:MAG: orotidine-5'-phosphate decarboxylase [Desulfovibrio sp.]|nr:orotidine-5'-phosphate decarboxylase [Desulfovibrio sp.]
MATLGPSPHTAPAGSHLAGRRVLPRLFTALDLPDAGTAFALAEKVGMLRSPSGSVGSGLKVGLELFSAAGPEPVRLLVDKGCVVFVDLKFHDIPNTVRRAVKVCCALGAGLLSLHLTGGGAMCRAAVAARDASGASTLLMGVSVLTGMDGAAAEITGRVLALARSAKDRGLDGVICSGREAAAVKHELGDDFLCLCPGIRFAGSAGGDDQARVCTPRDAVAAGADFLVMGRPIIGAADPAAAAAAALLEMETGLGCRDGNRGNSDESNTGRH